MVSTKHCFYKGCRNDTRYPGRPSMRGTFFIPFPKPKRQLVKCKKWLRCIGKEYVSTEKINKGTYICSKHFVGFSGPTASNPDPVPHEEEGSTILKKSIQETVEVNDKLKQIFGFIRKSETSDQFLNIKHTYSKYPNAITPKLIEKTNNETQEAEIVTVVLEELSLEIVKQSSFHDHPYSKEAIDELPSNEPMEIQQQVFLDDNNEMIVGLEVEIPLEELSQTTSENNLSDVKPKKLKDFIPWEPLPSGWTYLFTNGELRLMKFSSKTLPIITITVGENLHYSLTVHGHTFKCTEVETSKTLPIVSNFEELLSVVHFIDNFKICRGSPEERFLKYAEIKYETGQYCFVSNAMRSTGCAPFLEKSSKRVRCAHCAQFRKFLGLKLFRFTKNKFKQRKRCPANLTREEMMKEMVLAKRRLKSARHTISLLRQRAQKELSKNNVSISQDDSDSFQTNNNGEKEGPFTTVSFEKQLKIHKAKKQKISKWNPQIIDWSLDVRRKSPSTYEALRDCLSLPASRTLYNYSNITNHKTRGFQKIS